MKYSVSVAEVDGKVALAESHELWFLEVFRVLGLKIFGKFDSSLVIRNGVFASEDYLVAYDVGSGVFRGHV